jgi:hypothetical protein
MDINNACKKKKKKKKENITIFAKDCLGYYELKKHSHGSTNVAQNYYIKGNKLNCSGYRIQIK